MEIKDWLEKEECPKDEAELNELLGKREELKKVKNYDFVGDTVQEAKKNLEKYISKNYEKIKSSYERFFIYKYACDYECYGVIQKIIGEDKFKKFKGDKGDKGDKGKKYIIGDPDLYSNLLQDIYKLLWEDLTNLSCMQHKTKIFSDTMTSAMVRFEDAMKLSINLESERCDVADKIKKNYDKCKEIYGKCKEIYPRQQQWTTNFSIIIAASLGEDFYELIEGCYNNMGTFLGKVHTIGNYCPVPEGFNVARSGSFASHDYWDLTLMKIREWFLSKNAPLWKRYYLIQHDLLHNCDNETALKCIEWLEWFENKSEEKNGWHFFVEALHMQDYVDKDYSVKPF